VDGGGATELTSTIDVEPKTILVSGSDTLLEGLDALNLGTIDLGNIAEAQTLTMPIILPEGITNETGITEATVKVKFPNLRTTTLSLSRIEMINVPEGLEAELVTQILEVKFRGPASLIEALVAESVTVTVDLEGAEIGTDKYTAKINVGSAFGGVGALGTYTVMVTLTDAEAAR